MCPAVIAVRRDATLAGSLINALIAAGQEDDFIDPKGALPIISQRTLCIVVDTYQLGLVESREILEMRQGGCHRPPPQGRRLHREKRILVRHEPDAILGQ